MAEGHAGRLGPHTFQDLNSYRHSHEHQLAPFLAFPILKFTPTSLGCIRYGNVTCATPGIQESPDNPPVSYFQNHFVSMAAFDLYDGPERQTSLAPI